jgi:hypothetical protein
MLSTAAANANAFHLIPQAPIASHVVRIHAFRHMVRLQCPLSTTASSPPSTSTAPIIRQPVPSAAVLKRRSHRPATADTVNPNPLLPVADLSLPHAPSHDATLGGESKAGKPSSSNIKEDWLLPRLPISPIHLLICRLPRPTARPLRESMSTSSIRGRRTRAHPRDRRSHNQHPRVWMCRREYWSPARATV